MPESKMMTVDEYWSKSLGDKCKSGFLNVCGDKYRYILSRLDQYDFAGAKKLEIGCGYCHIAFHYKWDNYTGLDISDVGIRFAQKHLPKARFLHGALDAYKPKEKFDLIFAFDSLEHIPLGYPEVNTIIDASHNETIFIGNVPLVRSNHPKHDLIEHEMNEMILRKFLNKCRFYKIKADIYYVPALQKDLKIILCPFMFFEASKELN